jgi:hypothetical protein
MAEELKEYVVTLHRRENLEEFYEDMETPGGSLYIPNRKVDCANRREISRNTHYYLTQEEALQLMNDPRVRGVDPLDMLIPTPLWNQYNENFSKIPYQSQHINWALLRCIEGNHRTGWDSDVDVDGEELEEGYVFAYREGENVDVVVFDGIIDPAHPEFAVNSNGTGGSRVIREDWWQYIPSKTTSYPYTDIFNAATISDSEHGQHVAGTVAGNRQGWARKTNIYNIDVYNSSLGQFNIYGWDAVRAWHAAKPINPATGRKNPTVTNHSYGFQLNSKIDQISRILYRGIVYFNPIKSPGLVGRPDHVEVNFQDWTNAEWEEKGFREVNLNFADPGQRTLFGIGFPSVAWSTDQEDALDEGIFIIAAGGNGKNILALPGDPDYDNSITTDAYFGGILPVSYCRGMGHSYDSILVGNIGTARGSDSTKEPLAETSAKGRGITVFAPGTNIFSAGYTGNIQDPRNSAYRLVKKTGTSMASPQVAGIVACTMEKHYTATPVQMKQYIIDNAKTGQISENDVDGRGKALFTLTGTPDRYLFYPSDLNEDAPVSYTITPSSSSVNEGQSVTFNITSQYVPTGTLVNWRIISISGTLTTSDFSDGVLQGSLTINNATASLTKTLAEDFTTEGQESFALELSVPGGAVLATSNPVTVVDTSREPVYNIAANKSSMNEGDSITFTATTQGVQNNTTLYWTAQGSADGSDFSQGASGTVLITGSTSSGVGSFSLTTTEDRLTESSESFRIYLRTGSLSGTLVATSDEITISDTSRNPTYSIVGDKSNINEGETVTFTVSTTDVPNNTTLYWTTTGAVSAADFSDNTLSGSVLITGTSANGTGTITRTLTRDRLTEGFESFILNLKIGSTSGGTVATSGGVIVTDTSLSPTYTLSVDKNSTTESSNIIITLRTTGVDNNTLVPYVIYGDGIDTTDFLDIIQLTGNFNVTSNISRLILDINPDVTTEGTEAVYLALTGPERNEKIGFVILDTSTAPPSGIVKLYISSSAPSIREGSYLTFNIDATGIDTNLTVPYELLGITAADLLDPSQIRGNIVLTYDPFAIISSSTAGSLAPLSGTGVASGSLTIGVLENFRTDGLRTVFLSLTPDFPYEVEVNSTITIIDSSPGTDPAYTFTLDKYSVIEGQNVEVTVTTTNVADNTIITANIIPFGNSKIEVSDFVGLDKLLIEFPPTSGNTTSYTLQTADDFIFEQSEYFYLGITGTTFTSGTIEILDSGNTLIESAETYTGNISIRFLDKALLEPDLGGFTIGKSTWEDTAGMLSEKVFVQGKTPYAGPDATPFYQPFSYVIRSNKSIELWRNSIKDILHPAGLALFSEIGNETQPEDIRKVPANVSLDSEISDFFALTADSQKPPFYVSSNLYSNSRFEIPLKSDFAYYIHKYF